jgi:hypothetical protein
VDTLYLQFIFITNTLSIWFTKQYLLNMGVDAGMDAGRHEQIPAKTGGDRVHFFLKFW